MQLFRLLGSVLLGWDNSQPGLPNRNSRTHRAACQSAHRNRTAAPPANSRSHDFHPVLARNGPRSCRARTDRTRTGSSRTHIQPRRSPRGMIDHAQRLGHVNRVDHRHVHGREQTNALGHPGQSRGEGQRFETPCPAVRLATEPFPSRDAEKNSTPARSAICTTSTISGHSAGHRSGTFVRGRPPSALTAKMPGLKWSVRTPDEPSIQPHRHRAGVRAQSLGFGQRYRGRSDPP